MWLTDRTQASFPSAPSIGYAYTLSKTAPNAVATTTLGVGSTITKYQLFDGLGQDVQTQAPSSGGGGTIVTDTFRDKAGQVNISNGAYWTTSVSPSANLFVPSSEAAIPSETVTTFDGAGRATTATVYSLGVQRSQTTNSYLGADRVDTTPPAGGTPTSVFTNTQNQRTQLVQYLAATPVSTAPTETTTYSYDAQSRMTGMADPAGNHWGWSFDTLGHQIQAVDPDTGTTTSTYDDAGNLLTTTDARGVTLAYSYDALNRKTGEFVGSTSGAKLAGWTFDAAAKGQPDSSTSYVGSSPGALGAAYTSTVTAYDNGYRPTSTTVSIPVGAPAFGGTSYTTGFAYNQNGSLGVETYPAEGGLASERVRTTYDSNGLVTGLSGISPIGSVGYTGIDQIAQIQRSSSAELFTDYQYDPATGAASEIKDSSSTGAAFTVQADRKYSHNPSGDVTGIATTGAAGTDYQCFNYDYLHDLTEAWTPTSGDCAAAPSSTGIGGAAPYWTSYIIDPATGNRTQVVRNPTSTAASATTDTYSYAAPGTAHPHAVQTVTRSAGTGATDTYGYDSAGDTTARPSQSLTYDAAGKPSTVTAGGVTQTNIYDAAGTLLMQSDGTNGTTLYLGDTELHVAAGSTTTSVVRTYILCGVPVAERTTTAGVAGSDLAWTSGDASHTQDLEIGSSTGTVTRRYVDPYGNQRGTPAPWTSDHGYLNAPESAVTGLVQLGARAFDAGLGRFTSVDSVLAPSNPQQNNGYSYSANNPVTESDPDGDCYSAGTDSLTTRTNCVGSTGSAAGAGAASAANGGAVGGQTKNGSHGSSSADYVYVPPAGNASSKQDNPAPRPWWQQDSYSYHLKNWLGVGLDKHSAKGIARVFKDHPAEIFPFKVDGCSRFSDGATCRLVNAAPTPFGDASGTVAVETTDTSVKFTVVSNDYFDGPGSTIEFKIVHRADGYYIDQIANARKADVFVAESVKAGNLAQIMWAQQEANLREAVLKYGK